MMHRFCILFFILASLISSTVAPNVPCPPNRSIGDNQECIDQQAQDSRRDSNEIPSKENMESTMPATVTDSIDDGIDNGDQSEIDFSTTRKPINIRKPVNSIGKETESSSNSQEVESSGENYPFAMNQAKEATNLIGSNEAVFNISHNKVSSNDTNISDSVNDTHASMEVGSGEGNVSNSKTAEEGQIIELEKKVELWQKAVDNYLSTGQQRRKRRQAPWPQLFSSNPYPSTKTSSTKTSTGSMASFASGVSDAVGDALKPAMELMTQGVDLLSDLYSAKLTRSSGSTALATTNDTLPADQFRNQLKQLQGKLGDLGQQLQRVVSSFQQLQIPFLDNMLSGGLFPLAAPPVVSDGKNGKAKQYKRDV